MRRNSGTLTAPREFNLMFKTDRRRNGRRRGRGLSASRDGPGHLRQLQERARQLAGSACRSASPRSARVFATRSRRATSPSARASSSRWRSSSSAIRSRRREWYQYLARSPLSSGISTWAWPGERLRLRDHDQEELSHYSCGTADIEYAFPFLPPGEFGELEGIAHRGDFDLRSHMEGKLVTARRDRPGRRTRPRRQAASTGAAARI